MSDETQLSYISQALDRAVNEVMQREFDLYFDRQEADRVFQAWLAKRLRHP